jgi:hypothetical protein
MIHRPAKVASISKTDGFIHAYHAQTTGSVLLPSPSPAVWTRAAENLSITQSATSMSLSDFETQLGRKLFDRIGKRLQLNDAGRLLLPKALDALARLQEIEAMAASDAPLIGQLRIGASLTIGNYMLPGPDWQLHARPRRRPRDAGCRQHPPCHQGTGNTSRSISASSKVSVTSPPLRSFPGVATNSWSLLRPTTPSHARPT